MTDSAHNRSSRVHTPVAIVGGGPVGMLLALFLDRLGVRSTVINTATTTRWHPKGSTHNARTMEHYRRCGISSQIRQLGLPEDYPTDVAYFTRFGNYELARICMPSTREKLLKVAESVRTDQTPEPIHRCNQMYVERFLLDEVRRRPLIDVRFGCTVTDFRQDDLGVDIEAVETQSQQSVAFRADYLVGCDGGQGFVRRALGIKYHGQPNLKQPYLGGRMVSTHVRAPTLDKDILSRRRRAYQYWAVNQHARNTMVALNGADEFLFWTVLSESQSEPDDNQIIRAMQSAAGAEIPVEIIAHTPWTAGTSIVAEHFGDRRVLLAGDAIHLFTPTGGFGMNTGIDDAANLSWKLAACLQGWGGASLLESYEQERLPIAIRNTGAARQLAANVGALMIPAELEEGSEEGDRARQEFGRILSGFGEEFGSLGVQLGARYDGSSIIQSDAEPPSDEFANYRPSSVPGGRLPHIWIDSSRAAGSSLYDHLGPGFTLLRFGTKASAEQGFVEAAEALGLPMTVFSIEDDEAREFYQRDLLLVRPDQYVAWRGSAAPDDIPTLLKRATGFA